MGVWGKGEGTFTKVPSPFPQGVSTPLQLGRVGDHSGNGGCGGHGRVGEVDFGLQAAHASFEVAVGGSQSAFAGSQNAQVPAKARAAGGGPEYAAGLEHGFDQPFLKGLHPDAGGGGQHDAAQAFFDLAAGKDGRGDS